MRRWLLLSLVVLALPACQTRLAAPSPDSDRWQTSKTQQLPTELPEQWMLNAKAGLVINNKSEQANLSWQRSPQLSSPRNNQIKLFGPFGSGAVELAYGERNVVLTDSKGKEYWGDNAEALLTDIIGWPLPLDALQYWLFAAPAPDSTYEFQLDDAGALTALRQKGWEIEYSDARNYQGQVLPRKIFARKTTTRRSPQKVSVRVVVKSWQWPE